MAGANTVVGLFPSLRRGHIVTIDPTMQAVFAALFAAATGAIGWLVGKLWTDRADMQGKVFTMLDKQFEDANRRKDLFDNLGKTIDGQTQAVKELRDTFTREVLAVRADLQRIKP
jgi:hypothetical protein